MNWKFMLVLTGSFLLAACGGSDESTDDTQKSVSYTGKTSAAVIDDQSAPVLVDTVIGSSDTQNLDIMRSATDADDSVSDEFDAITGIRLLHSKVTELIGGADTAEVVVSRAVVSESETYNGSCSGSITETYTYEDNNTPDYYEDDYPVQIKLNFTNYSDDCEVILDGGMTLSILYEGTELSGMELSTAYFSVAYDGQRFAYTGSYKMTLSGYSESGYETIVVNMDFTGPDSHVYRMENYTMLIDMDELVSISGRIYHPTYGYVDISTPTLFSYVSCGYLPDSGVLRISGEGEGMVEVNAGNGDCDTYLMTWTTDGGVTNSEIRYW